MAKKNDPAAAPTAPASPNVQTSSKSKTVTVMCKVPTGLRLQLQKQIDWPEDTPSGPIMRKRWDRFGPVVNVQGPATAVGAAPRGYKPPIVAGGYALTQGVDRTFFEEWMKQNRDNPVVVNRMIMAQPDMQSAASQSREYAETRSGFEPLDVESGKDSRIPKPATAGVGAITTAEEMSNRQHFHEAAQEVSTADI